MATLGKTAMMGQRYPPTPRSLEDDPVSHKQTTTKVLDRVEKVFYEMESNCTMLESFPLSSW